jgi:hypothetical protein
VAEVGPDERLVGAWTLLSWQIFGTDQATFTEPFGAHPVGLLLYTADGWMSAAIGSAGRPLHPAGISPRRMKADQLADSWRSYFHYAGRWRIEGDDVIHSVTLSLNPNMVGSEQIRRMDFAGRQLTLTGIEHAGQQRRHVLVWQRASQTANNLE